MGCYSELITIPTIEERFKYLQRLQRVGEQTFGGERYLNQRFYSSTEWKYLRYKIAIRDDGCDLAVPGYPVGDKPRVHHINPLTIEDLKNGSDSLFDPENLILCSFNTHNAIHYGDLSLIPGQPVERRPNDTCPWR